MGLGVEVAVSKKKELGVGATGRARHLPRQTVLDNSEGLAKMREELAARLHTIAGRSSV